MTIRVLVTGSRDFPESRYLEIVRGISLGIEQVAKERPDEKEIVVVHGAARGADRMAKRFVDQAVSYFRTHGTTIRQEPHPVTEAEWARFKGYAGNMRNQKMVDLGADICVAFYYPGCKGTKDCVKRAEEAGIPVLKFGDIK